MWRAIPKSCPNMGWDTASGSLERAPLWLVIAVLP